MAHESILLSLPNEILASILRYIPNDDEAVLDISRVCKKLYRLSNSRLEWKDRCRQFRYWEPKHKFQEKLNNPLSLEVDWKLLFVRKWSIRKRTAQLLDQIISSPINRIPKYHEMGKFGYDAKDYLAEQAKAPEDLEDVLARRWFAATAIHYIHRRQGIMILQRIASGEDVPLEVALSVFELFNLRTAENGPEETAQILDDLANRFKSQTPGINQLSTKMKAVALCKFMGQEGFRGATSESYRALKNSYIGISLRTDRVNLPLTATAIYCSLAQRIGISAYPCGFPYHVLTIVKDTNGEYIYLDPLRADGNILPVAGLENQLHMLGIGDTKQDYLCPSPTSEIVLRTARNIVESLRYGIVPAAGPQQPALVNRDSALYAALITSVLLRSHITDNLVANLTRMLTEDLSMDVQFFEQDVLRRVTNPDSVELVKQACAAHRKADSSPRPPILRSGEDQVMKYTVGTVFSHKTYNYQGVIFGWSPSCESEAGEEWIEIMGVYGLRRGKKQPFYHALVEDGTFRYVAEENVKQIRPKAGTINELCQLAGKYFKRYSQMDGTFISNDMTAYPEG